MNIDSHPFTNARMLQVLKTKIIIELGKVYFKNKWKRDFISLPVLFLLFNGISVYNQVGIFTI